jgi:type I restriction enzyme S subunit
MVDTRQFGSLFLEPTRNGLTRPKSSRGAGVKMVNMGELFANRRLQNVSMDRVPLSEHEARSYLLYRKDLLFARQSLVLEGAGRCSIFVDDDEPVTFESHLIRVRLDSKIADPHFYFYFFTSPDGRDAIRRIVVQGAGAAGIRASDLPNVDVPWFPPSEQRAIARILGALDDKIDLNRRMNETLEAMARALFKSWFVDFDPVRAKMRGEQPAGKDAATAALFPSRLVHTEHGEVPEGWRHAPLSEWVEVLSGGTPSKANPALWNGSLKWISPKAMLRIHADECEDCVTRDAVGNGTRLAPMGATLVMVRGMGLHDGFRVSQVREDVTFNQDVKALVPQRVHPDLLLFAMLDGQQALHQRVESSGHGTGKMPTEILVSYPLILPTPSTQQVLGSRFTALNDRIAANSAESRTLAVLRDSLLPKLLSGELRVPDAERAVAEVA